MQNKRVMLLVKILVVVLVMSLCSSTVFADGLNGVGGGNTTTVVSEEVVTSTQTEDVNSNVIESSETTTVAESTTVPEVVTTGETQTSIGSSVGLPQTTQKEEIQSAASAVGDLFSGAGPRAEDIKEAGEFIQPFANILNKVMAVILGITSLLMMFITVLDLLYIAFPPVRDMLDGGRKGAANMMGGRGVGARMGGRMGGYGGRIGGYGGYGGPGMMGGMAGGMSGYGAGGMGGAGGVGVGQAQDQQFGGGLSAVGRWVSDEAVSACLEAQGGVGQGMPGAAGANVKSIVVSYMKKRSMFLILFGVCVVLFTSTVFTDLGIRLGTWFLNIILGF